METITFLLTELHVCRHLRATVLKFLLLNINDNLHHQQINQKIKYPKKNPNNNKVQKTIMKKWGKILHRNILWIYIINTITNRWNLKNSLQTKAMECTGWKFPFSANVSVHQGFNSWLLVESEWTNLEKAKTIYKETRHSILLPLQRF